MTEEIKWDRFYPSLLAGVEFEDVGLVAKKRENADKMRETYRVTMGQLLSDTQDAREQLEKLSESISDARTEVKNLTNLVAKQDFAAAEKETVLTEEIHCDLVKTLANTLNLTMINSDGTAVEEDATKDIIETPEMTEEAEDAINYLFERVENRADKIRVEVQENGGAFVTFRNHKLNIYANGLRFALKDTTTEDVSFFRDTNKEELRSRIYNILNVPKESLPEEIDAAHDISAPVAIKLKKGFDRLGMQKFIKRVDKFLMMRNERKLTTRVIVTTEEWKDDVRPFACIPAAKKMFAKYAEAGLLASLAFNNFTDAAREFYCIAYVKGKVKNDETRGPRIEFTGIDPNDFKNRLMTSAENLQKIFDLEDEESVE